MARTKHVFLLLLAAVLVNALMACGAPKLRDDPEPSPSAADIGQDRLEFAGCGYASIIGTVACGPGKLIQAVTEYKGQLTMVSSGGDCSLSQQISVTPPLTTITLPDMGNEISCAVNVIYLPAFPNAASPIPTRSLIGQVVYMSNNSWPYKGNYALSTFQTLRLTFPGAVRGGISSRELDAAQAFTGNTFSIKPKLQGNDFILVKTWDAAGKITQMSYTANYYSPAAMQLTYSTNDDDGLTIIFPDSVSVVTVAGKPTYDTSVDIDDNFTGYVRAYTAQGRTLVIYISAGEIQWAH